MAAISCPSCGKTLNVTEQYAGKKVRCPNCQGVLTVPALQAPPTAQLLPSEEVVPAAPPRPARPAMPPVPPPQPEPDYRRPAPPPGRYDDYDDRRRPGPPPGYGHDDRRLRRPGQQWAPCPSCGGDEATRVNWTFWGGLIGPAIINVVRCHRCGSSYNGVHGDYNGGRIAVYVIISIVLGLVIAGVAIAAATMK